MPTQRGAGRPAGARARSACTAPRFSPPRAARTACGTQHRGGVCVRLGLRAPAKLSQGWDAEQQCGSRSQGRHRVWSRSWLYPAGAFQALKSYPAPPSPPTSPQPSTGGDPPCPLHRNKAPLPTTPCPAPTLGRASPTWQGDMGRPGVQAPDPPLRIADQPGSLLMEHGGKRAFWWTFFIFCFLRGFMLLKVWGPAAPLPWLPSTQALKGAGLAALEHPKSVGVMWPPPGWCLLMSPRPRTAMRGCGAGRRCSLPGQPPTSRAAPHIPDPISKKRRGS